MYKITTIIATSSGFTYSEWTMIEISRISTKQAAVSFELVSGDI